MIEKKKMQDAMQLNIYNQTKQEEENKELLIKQFIKSEENVIKVVQKDLLTQSENFKKKLAERKKIKLMSMSMNQSLNSSLSLNFTGLKQRGD